MRKLSHLHTLLLGTLLAACSPAKLESLEAISKQTLLANEPQHLRLIELSYEPTQGIVDSSWRREYAALTLALFEHGLAELKSAVPYVKGVAQAPGVMFAQDRKPQFWTATLTDTGDISAYAMRLKLCRQEGACVNYYARGLREQPHVVSAELLTAAASTLGLAEQTDDESPLYERLWQKPVSKDPYAVRLLGRAAAIFYGMSKPLDEDRIGDQRLDPLARAIFVDPHMQLGYWFVGRRLVKTDPQDAAFALARAYELNSESNALLADAAVTFLAANEIEQAQNLWDILSKRDFTTLRLALPRAQTYFAAQRYVDAEYALTSLPTFASSASQVLAMRVKIAEAIGRHDVDDLLVRWQDNAKEALEPVQKRIQRKIKNGAFAEALQLTDELAMRGAESEALKLRLALTVGLRDYNEAVWVAEALDQRTLAQRLRLRQALESQSKEALQLFGLRDVDAMLLQAQIKLQSQHFTDALVLANKVLETDSNRSEALAIIAQALDGQGKTTQAEKFWDRLRSVDPVLAESLLRPVQSFDLHPSAML